MGIGIARKVKIVVVGQTMGVDGVDVTSSEVANLWAQINTISQPMRLLARTSGSLWASPRMPS